MAPRVSAWMASPRISAAGVRLKRWHAATKAEPRGPAISPPVHSMNGRPAKPFPGAPRARPRAAPAAHRFRPRPGVSRMMRRVAVGGAALVHAARIARSRTHRGRQAPAARRCSSRRCPVRRRRLSWPASTPKPEELPTVPLATFRRVPAGRAASAACKPAVQEANATEALAFAWRSRAHRAPVQPRRDKRPPANRQPVCACRRRPSPAAGPPPWCATISAICTPSGPTMRTRSTSPRSGPIAKPQNVSAGARIAALADKSSTRAPGGRAAGEAKRKPARARISQRCARRRAPMRAGGGGLRAATQACNLRAGEWIDPL